MSLGEFRLQSGRTDRVGRQSCGVATGVGPSGGFGIPSPLRDALPHDRMNARSGSPTDRTEADAGGALGRDLEIARALERPHDGSLPAGAC